MPKGVRHGFGGKVCPIHDANHGDVRQDVAQHQMLCRHQALEVRRTTPEFFLEQLLASAVGGKSTGTFPAIHHLA